MFYLVFCTVWLVIVLFDLWFSKFDYLSSNQIYCLFRQWCWYFWLFAVIVNYWFCDYFAITITTCQIVKVWCSNPLLRAMFGVVLEPTTACHVCMEPTPWGRLWEMSVFSAASAQLHGDGTFNQWDIVAHAISHWIYHDPALNPETNHGTREKEHAWASKKAPGLTLVVPLPKNKSIPGPAFNQAEIHGIRLAQETKKASSLTPMVMIPLPPVFSAQKWKVTNLREFMG